MDLVYLWDEDYNNIHTRLIKDISKELELE